MSGEPSPPDKHPAPASGARYRAAASDPAMDQTPSNIAIPETPRWVQWALPLLNIFLIARLSLSRPISDPLTIAMGVLLVCLVSFKAWQVVQRRRLLQIIKEHRRFLCIKCRYPLRGLAEEGRCPECDEPYTRAERWQMWNAWEEAYNGKPLFPDEPVEGVR